MLSNELREAVEYDEVPWDAKTIGEAQGRRKKTTKGDYVDFSGYSLEQAKKHQRDVLDELAMDLFAILDVMPVAFIRDPEGVLEAAGIGPGDIAKAVGAEAISAWDHAMRATRDAGERYGWQKSIELGRKATFSVRKVMGRTGAGWRVEMHPDISDILTRAFGPVPVPDYQTRR